MKLKTLIHTLIVSRMCRIIRALSKLKAIILDILRDTHPIIHHRKHYTKNNIILGSFRLHYNWCSSKSSHVLPVPARVYDSTWKHNVSTDQEQLQGGDDCHAHDDDSQLAGYLQWLEDKGTNNEEKKGEINEIDMLAEMFIANCHEKFLLEKQESDRRFQEMLARSM